MKNWMIWFFAFAMLWLCLGIGVGEEQSSAPEYMVVKDIERGERGGQLVFAEPRGPKTFNLIMAEETSSTDVVNRMFSGLVEFDQITQEFKPGLAKRWEHSDDYKTWTFHLRKGLRWSDGHPLTADDVVFGFRIVYDPEIPNSVNDVLRVDGKPFKVEKVDDQTVRMHLPDTYAPFLSSIGTPAIVMPKHKLEKVVEEGRFPEYWSVSVDPKDLVVSGAFMLEKYVSGEKVVLARNPHYWKVDAQGQQLPYLDKLIFLIVPDMNAMQVRFQAGEADILDPFYGDKYRMLKDDEQKGNYTVYDLGPSLGSLHIWFNLNPEKNPKTEKPFVDPVKLRWFQEVKFRKAVAYAINRKGIARVVYYGRGVPIWSPMGPNNKRWYNPEVPKYEFDLKKADALLKELNYIDRDGDGIREDPQGNKISFLLITNVENNYRTKMSAIITDDLRKVGIDAKLRFLDFNAIVTKLSDTYDFEACLLGLTAGTPPEPANGKNVFLSSGRLHHWYPRQKTPATPWEARIDELMSLYIKEPRYEVQKKYIDELQYIMADQLPMIYLVNPHVLVAIRNKFGNVEPSIIYHHTLWNIEEVFVK